MNQEFILGKLSEIMKWGTDQSRREFAWLDLMSKMKYDGYQDFRAGARFVESLADWLQQFPTLAERETAYGFVRKYLVYVSPGEMNHLVELFFPETVQWRLMQKAAAQSDVPIYRLWANTKAAALYDRLLRQTLFIELSDGARIDVFRRANAGLVSNEQVVTAPRINKAKWDDLLKDLQDDLKDPEAQFAFVFLVDDFIASGTTLLRWEKDKNRWNGKMLRFWDDVEEAGVAGTHFEPTWVLCVHHYLATHRARETAEQRHAGVLKERRDAGQDWFERVKFSYGMVLPESFPVDQAHHGEFLKLVENYYDDVIETKHMKLGGEDARLGFGKCALPLVLEHNTPNNSLSLLWADTPGEKGKHSMRPLFRRRQRHT
ncbi:MAG: hypothetical protein K9N21_19850 [Deltaproteobacteria bacterium]|nr:hypothetical protein [Deltaproteobacteria bacterium]